MPPPTHCVPELACVFDALFLALLPTHLRFSRFCTLIYTLEDVMELLDVKVYYFSVSLLAFFTRPLLGKYSACSWLYAAYIHRCCTVWTACVT